MESVFIRFKIKYNNLQASIDAATKSNCHPGRKSTLKKKSVQIRVYPCPILHDDASATPSVILSSLFPSGTRVQET